MILCTQNLAATSFFIHRAEILISSRDEMKRCIAAKRENCWGNFGDVVLRIYVWKLYWGFWGDIVCNQRCCWKYIFKKHKNGREDSQNRRATSRLRMYEIGKHFGAGIFGGDIFLFYILLAQRCWWGCYNNESQIWWYNAIENVCN